MKPLSYKRICAYFLDILIVSFISLAFTYFIPTSKEYDDNINKYQSLLSEFSSEDIEPTEFINQTNDLIYILNKESIPVTIVNLVLTIIYFVVIQYFMNGQTLGKKLMNLKIIPIKNKKITMNNYLIRSLLINSVFMNTLRIILILILKKSIYIKVNDITTYLFGGIYLISLVMILLREDGRGIHDLIASTRVISLNDYVDDNENSLEIENKDSKMQDVSLIKKTLEK